MAEINRSILEINKLKEKLDGRSLFAKLVNNVGEAVNFDNGCRLFVHYLCQPTLFYPSTLQVNSFDENYNIISSKQTRDVINNFELTVKTGKMIDNKIDYFNRLQILTGDNEVIFEKSFEPESVKEGKSITLTYII